MTAQEECLRQHRESFLELCDAVHKAAITLAEKSSLFTSVCNQKRNAEAQFNEAMARLKAYKGILQ